MTRPRRPLRPGQLALVLAVSGAVLSGAMGWTAWSLNHDNESRLLVVQTHQAAAVIASEVVSITAPLDASLDVAVATGGSPSRFASAIGPSVGAKGLFVTAELWSVAGATPRMLASVGIPALLPPATGEARSLVARAAHATTFVVQGIPKSGPNQRVAYAASVPADRPYVVYAERAIPANRVEPVETDSAFADLDFASYLGPKQSLSDLATTDLPLSALPIGKSGVVEEIPFGDSEITLVTKPRVALGGSLGRVLPWIFLFGGLLLSVGVSWAARQLVRRRRDAEASSRTIASLYEDLDRLYGEQRSIAGILQSALLPTDHPPIEDLEIVSRYVAGSEGVEIGGDWFSVIELDEQHFAFAIGDVSGRGIGAAAVMARLRFSIEGFLTEGHQPDVVLALSSRRFDIQRSHHFATVLVGIGDLTSGSVSIASAGHFGPLLVSADGSARHVPVPLGPPLGIASEPYRVATFDLEPGSTLIGFTDGLVERRGEVIDAGLERLAVAASVPGSSALELVASVLARLYHEGSQDDLAVVAIRRVPRSGGSPGAGGPTTR